MAAWACLGLFTLVAHSKHFDTTLFITFIRFLVSLMT